MTQQLVVISELSALFVKSDKFRDAFPRTGATKYLVPSELRTWMVCRAPPDCRNLTNPPLDNSSSCTHGLSISPRIHPPVSLLPLRSCPRQRSTSRICFFSHHFLTEKRNIVTLAISLKKMNLKKQ